MAATVLLLVGLYLVLALEASAGRRGVAVTTLCVLMGSLYALVLILPWGGSSLRFRIPPWESSASRLQAAPLRSPDLQSRTTVSCRAARTDLLRESRIVGPCALRWRLSRPGPHSKQRERRN